MKYRIRFCSIGTVEIDEAGRASGSPPELVSMATRILEAQGAAQYMAEPWLLPVQEIARFLGATVERIGELPPDDPDAEPQLY